FRPQPARLPKARASTTPTSLTISSFLKIVSLLHSRFQKTPLMSQLWTSFLMDLLKRKRGVDRDMAPSSHLTDSDLAAKMIEAQDSIISRRSGKATPTVLDTPEPTSTHGAEAFKNDEDYF